jgi:hypothetical protein
MPVQNPNMCPKWPLLATNSPSPTLGHIPGNAAPPFPSPKGTQCACKAPLAGRFLIEKKKKKQERLVTSHFYIVGTVVVISWWPLDGCCSFLVASGWLLFFPGGLWMVAVLSWWPLDGCCYFLVASGWLLLFPGGLWMVAVVSW